MGAALYLLGVYTQGIVVPHSIREPKMKTFSALVLAFICTLLLSTPAKAISFERAMKSVDPSAKYLFYLHGAIMEKQGKKASSPRYGVYLYRRIIEHFEDRGLVVIEEVRGPVNPHQYAAMISKQIHRLMAAGVPPFNITVSGFSKGGSIALLLASSMNDPNLRYVIMAGCGKGQYAFGFEQFLKKKRGARLKGHILSIYATSDLDAGSCRPAIEQSSGEGLTFIEKRIRSNKGHGLFYQPRPEWITPVAFFALGEM